MCTSYACAHDKQRPMSVLRFYGARRLPPCPWSNTDHLSLALFPLFSPPFFSFSLYFRPSCPRLSGSRLLNVSQSPPSLRAGIRSRLELDRCRVPSRIPWGRESLGCVTPRLGFEKTRSWQRTLAQGPGAHPSFTPPIRLIVEWPFVKSTHAWGVSQPAASNQRRQPPPLCIEAHKHKPPLAAARRVPKCLASSIVEQCHWQLHHSRPAPPSQLRRWLRPACHLSPFIRPPPPPRGHFPFPSFFSCCFSVILQLLLFPCSFFFPTRRRPTASPL